MTLENDVEAQKRDADFKKVVALAQTWWGKYHNVSGATTAAELLVELRAVREAIEVKRKEARTPTERPGETAFDAMLMNERLATCKFEHDHHLRDRL